MVTDLCDACVVMVAFIFVVERKVFRPNDIRQVRCFNCGGFGHQAVVCQSPRMPKACYTCGSTFHLSHEWYVSLFLFNVLISCWV